MRVLNYIFTLKNTKYSEFDNVKNATQIMLIQIRTRVNKILKKNIPVSF